jgi:hypothetical protein
MFTRFYSTNTATDTMTLPTPTMLLKEPIHTNTSIPPRSIHTIICPIFITDMDMRNSKQ